MRVEDVETVERPPYARQFGERVHELRKAKGWTQGELAKRLVAAGHKLHQSTVARMEVGERPTSVDEVAALARIFGVPIPALFEPAGLRANTLFYRLGEVKRRLDDLEDELSILGEQADRLTAERENLAREYASLEAELDRQPAETVPF